MSLSFVIERLIKRKVNFSDQIKKVSLDVELKKTEKVRKEVSAMKEVRQVIWGNVE